MKFKGRVYCKETLFIVGDKYYGGKVYTDGIYFTKGKYYLIDDYLHGYYFIMCDLGFIGHILEAEMFRYFYTDQELRREKLEKFGMQSLVG